MKIWIHRWVSIVAANDNFFPAAWELFLLALVRLHLKVWLPSASIIFSEKKGGHMCPWQKKKPRQVEKLRRNMFERSFFANQPRFWTRTSLQQNLTWVKSGETLQSCEHLGFSTEIVGVWYLKQKHWRRFWWYIRGMLCIPQCKKMIENETTTNIQISDFTCCVKLYRAMAYSKGKGYGKGKQSEYLDYCVSRVDPADRGMRTQKRNKNHPKIGWWKRNEEAPKLQSSGDLPEHLLPLSRKLAQRLRYKASYLRSQGIATRHQ